jgi:hypothetical protein
MKTLREIGLEAGTDKVRTHRYDPSYERHLGHLRDREFTLLEIGVAFGQSLKMWREYFPKARIYGIDKYPKVHEQAPPGTTAFAGDQGDVEFLKRVTSEVGGFDVVIDDGSHRMDHHRISLFALFPHVRPGGFYIIEDLGTCYNPKAGGGPVGAPGTTMELLKSFTEDMNYPFHREPLVAPAGIASIHFYHGIAFIERK